MANHQQRVSFQPGRTLLGPTISTCWFHPVSSGHEPKAERREQQCDSQYCGKKNTWKKKKKQSLQSASLVALQDAASARYIYTRPVTVSVMFYRLEIVSRLFGMENFCEACSDRSNAVLFSWWSGARVPGPSNSLPSSCHDDDASCPFLFFCPNFSMFKAEEGQKIEPYWHDTQWMLRRSLTHGQIEWSDMAKLLMRYAPIIPMILVNGSEGIGRQML